MIRAEANASFEAVVDFFGLSGLDDGTLTFRIDDNLGNTVLGPTGTGISEIASPGIYSKTNATAPGTEGQFTIVWDDGTGDNVAIEDLLVVAAGAADTEYPLVPAEGPDAPVMGPCSAWTTGYDVAQCAGVDVGSANEILLDQVAVEASMLLYEFSAFQFSGQCSHEVRPCSTRKGCLHDWALFDGERGYRCGCGALSQVVLPNYPVTSITEVLIDGDVVDPDTYRLDGYQRLTRTRDPAEPGVALMWPACQDMDQTVLTEPGTFVVRYLAGVNPPPLGERAAAQLGAELLRACPGSGASGECKLPSGVTRIVRQQVSMDFAGFRSFGWDRSKKVWNTGLTLVDAFLNWRNPYGQRRPAAFLSPDDPYFAEKVGGGIAGGS